MPKSLALNDLTKPSRTVQTLFLLFTCTSCLRALLFLFIWLNLHFFPLVPRLIIPLKISFWNFRFECDLVLYSFKSLTRSFNNINDQEMSILRKHWRHSCVFNAILRTIVKSFMTTTAETNRLLVISTFDIKHKSQTINSEEHTN